MGSVKDLRILKPASAINHGLGRFIFSNRYSVFDWGEMPDHIEHKGEAINLLSAYFFEKLEKMNIPTHYLGVVEDDVTRKLADIKNPSNIMEVKLLRVIRPELKDNAYNYSIYSVLKGCFLIPLEVIYRNFLPPGSSVFKRLKSGEIKPEDLGLNKEPVPNQKLLTPIYDFSTKLEVTDKYLKYKEAQQAASLVDEEMNKIKNIANIINDLITKEFAKINLINEDGKIELGFDIERLIILVDVLGTLDECRFTYNGLPVSKEIARIYYRNTDWYKATEEAKKEDNTRWKEICKLKPEPLPPGLNTLISQIYCACTNEITEREWFPNIPSLKNLLSEIKKILQI